MKLYSTIVHQEIFAYITSCLEIQVQSLAEISRCTNIDGFSLYSMSKVAGIALGKENYIEDL